MHTKFENNPLIPSMFLRANNRADGRTDGRTAPYRYTSRLKTAYKNRCVACYWLCGHTRAVNSPISSIPQCTKYPTMQDFVIEVYIISDQAEPWWRASIWRSHRKVVIKQCSYHNNIIDIQNRLPYSKVVYPAIIVLFSCLMEVNHGVRTGPDYPFR